VGVLGEKQGQAAQRPLPVLDRIGAATPHRRHGADNDQKDDRDANGQRNRRTAGQEAHQPDRRGFVRLCCGLSGHGLILSLTNGGA
jgi:hypothetical protein